MTTETPNKGGIVTSRVLADKYGLSERRVRALFRAWGMKASEFGNGRARYAWSANSPNLAKVEARLAQVANDEFEPVEVDFDAAISKAKAKK